MRDGCSYFTDLCRELFQLEQQYGYHPGPVAIHNHECSMMLTKGDREVLLLVDLGFGLPAILFRPPHPPERFGLHEAIAAIDPAYHARQPADVGYGMTASQLRALLEHYAVFFHAHWKELLEDHREVFAAVERYRSRPSG